MDYIRDKMFDSPVLLKVVNNLSIENKMFMSHLSEFKALSLKGDLVATYIVKNLGYKLPNPS